MIKSLKSVFRSVRDSWTALIFPVLSDLVFLLLLGFMLAPFFNRVGEMISVIGTRLIEAAGAVTGGVLQETFIKDIIAFSPELPGLLWRLAALLGMMLLMIYLLTTAFQAVSWYFCMRISGRNPGYYRLFIHLAKLNILWAIIFGLVHAVDLIVKANTVISTPTGVIPQTGWVMNIIYFVLIYFVSASYSRIMPFAQSLRLAFSREFTSSWALILIWFFAVIRLQSVLPSEWILLLQIFVTLPSLTFSRILLIRSTRKFK